MNFLVEAQKRLREALKQQEDAKPNASANPPDPAEPPAKKKKSEASGHLSPGEVDLFKDEAAQTGVLFLDLDFSPWTFVPF